MKRKGISEISTIGQKKGSDYRPSSSICKRNMQMAEFGQATPDYVAFAGIRWFGLSLADQIL